MVAKVYPPSPHPTGQALLVSVPPVNGTEPACTFIEGPNGGLRDLFPQAGGGSEGQPITSCNSSACVTGLTYISPLSSSQLACSALWRRFMKRAKGASSLCLEPLCSLLFSLFFAVPQLTRTTTHTPPFVDVSATACNSCILNYCFGNAAGFTREAQLLCGKASLRCCWRGRTRNLRHLNHLWLW